MLCGWLRLDLGFLADSDLLSCVMGTAAPEFGGESAFSGTFPKLLVRVDLHEKPTALSWKWTSPETAVCSFLIAWGGKASKSSAVPSRCDAGPVSGPATEQATWTGDLA